jgi:D-cysteine desulfhydrase
MNDRPRFPLAILPTPLVPARRLQEKIGGPLVWIKRDDLTGFATAGNKARSLEFLVGEALDRGCDVLVAGGGGSSNFCAAAAAAARVAGLDCHLVLYGGSPDDGDSHIDPHPNLAAALEAGAQVHYTGRPDREEVDRAVTELAATLAAEGHRPYPVPRGGATAVGAAGYAVAFDELAEQLSRLGVAPGAIVVATGSGGTQAGLVAARTGHDSAQARQWRIIGATVSRPPDQITGTVAALAGACSTLLGLAQPGPDPIEVVDARGNGFGVPSDAGERAARVARDSEGLVLDPVYTAKAFAVVLDLVADGFEQPIIFWHTGGWPAALHHLSSESSESSEWSTLCPT